MRWFLGKAREIAAEFGVPLTPTVGEIMVARTLLKEYHTDRLLAWLHRHLLRHTEYLQKHPDVLLRSLRAAIPHLVAEEERVIASEVDDGD